MSIYLLKHPEASQQNVMLHYLHTIRLAADMFPGRGWVLYDEQFRLRKDKRPLSNWATIDGELWLLYIAPHITMNTLASGKTDHVMLIIIGVFAQT